MEASSHGLDQYRLDGVRVTAAAFTNLSHDHLDYHADMASYFAAKLRLFADLLPQGGTAVVNADAAAGAARDRDRAPAPAAPHHLRQRRAPTSGSLKQKPTPQGQLLEIGLFGAHHVAEFPVAGGFQAENVLAALGLVIGSGVGRRQDRRPGRQPGRRAGPHRACRGHAGRRRGLCRLRAQARRARGRAGDAAPACGAASWSWCSAAAATATAASGR